MRSKARTWPAKLFTNFLIRTHTPTHTHAQAQAHTYMQRLLFIPNLCHIRTHDHTISALSIHTHHNHLCTHIIFQMVKSSFRHALLPMHKPTHTSTRNNARINTRTPPFCCRKIITWKQEILIRKKVFKNLKQGWVKKVRDLFLQRPHSSSLRRITKEKTFPLVY